MERVKGRSEPGRSQRGNSNSISASGHHARDPPRRSFVRHHAFINCTVPLILLHRRLCSTCPSNGHACSLEHRQLRWEAHCTLHTTLCVAAACQVPLRRGANQQPVPGAAKSHIPAALSQTAAPLRRGNSLVGRPRGQTKPLFVACEASQPDGDDSTRKSVHIVRGRDCSSRLTRYVEIDR